MARSEDSHRRTGPVIAGVALAIACTAAAPGAFTDRDPYGSFSYLDHSPLLLHTVQEEEPPTDPPLPPLYTHTVQEDEVDSARTASTRGSSTITDSLFGQPALTDPLMTQPDSSVVVAERLDRHAIPAPTGWSDWLPPTGSELSDLPSQDLFRPTTPPAAIPAPGALSLLALGIIALARRRRPETQA